MRILIAEDEQDLADVLSAMLEHNGYTVDVAANGLEAVRLAQANLYEVMVLDIMMPEMDGVTALRRIRETGNETPALFLTAKGEVDDRISGLDAGADDYLTKPFAIGELLARIRAMTRRNMRLAQKILRIGDLELDMEHALLSCVNSISLELHEARLMEFLMKNPGRPLAESDLYSHIWGENAEEGQAVVWMYISYLRGKLRSIGASIRIEGKGGESYTLRVTE